MTEKRRPTMTDVAALAGVSQTTVSLVLNGIAEARAAIAQIEAQLRQWGLPLGDCVDE